MGSFRRDLLNWYDKKKRTMPWRGSFDPYHIWLSEIMLQQTQVDTVRDYYLRWLKKFPTVFDVAAASEDSILKSWEGLGYYARARNFQKACQQVVQDYDGKVPSDTKRLSALKGIGPYTCAAIQSIAFQMPSITIDGNIKRVVARLLRITKPPSKALGKIESYLTETISQKRPGDFNQALMDLGATICTSKNFKCALCPVKKHCLAFKQGDVKKFPRPEKKIAQPHYKVAVGVVWKGKKILISKRKSHGMLGGLWEFPGGKIKKNESAKACVRREVKEEVGVDVKPLHSVGKIKHVYTHFSIEMEAYICDFVKGRPSKRDCAGWKWITFDEIKTLPFPKANHKLFPLIKKFMNKGSRLV